MIHVFVTGAGRGIGHAIVECAIQKGCHVTAQVRNPADGEKLRRAYGQKVQVVTAELTDPASIATLAQQVHHPIDWLVNNAGILPSNASPQEVTAEELSACFQVNAIAPLLVARALLPALRRSARPVIVNVSTQMSAMGTHAADTIAYRASKVALNKIMQGLATELSTERIPVLLIDPGWVKTDMGGRQAPLDPKDVARGILVHAAHADMSHSGRFFVWSGKEREF